MHFKGYLGLVYYYSGCTRWRTIQACHWGVQQWTYRKARLLRNTIQYDWRIQVRQVSVLLRAR